LRLGLSHPVQPAGHLFARYVESHFIFDQPLAARPDHLAIGDEAPLAVGLRLRLAAPAAGAIKLRLPEQLSRQSLAGIGRREAPPDLFEPDSHREMNG
jgi:hypothetical protein